MARNRIAIALIVIACAMIAFGVARGEAATVYKKARVICLECVGIG